jgi:hypothetical protein
MPDRRSEARSRGVFDGFLRGEFPATDSPSLTRSRHLLIPVNAFAYVGVV